jgi:hypothetical protein
MVHSQKNCNSGSYPVARNPIIDDHAREIRKLRARVGRDIISIGRHLTEAKKFVGHGYWLPWLEREFGWSDKTAERFMNVYALGGKFDNLSNLELPISALYMLAAPSTPNEARTEIIARAKVGETISTETVKNTIARRRSERPRNMKRANLLRRAKLTDELVDKLKAPAATPSPQVTGNAVDPEESAAARKGEAAADEHDHPVDVDDPTELAGVDDEDLDREVHEASSRKPRQPKRLSRSARWGAAAGAAIEAINELIELQGDYESWRDNLPENFQSSTLADKLDAVCELDFDSALGTIQEAEDLDLPLGFGRD